MAFRERVHNFEQVNSEGFSSARAIEVLTKAALLVVAVFLLLCTRPYTDLLPVPIRHDLLPGIPPVLPPFLVFFALAVWFWNRTGGNRFLFGTKLFACVPVIITLSVPNLPQVLFEKEWMLSTFALFLLSPFLIALTLPRLKAQTLPRRAVYILSYWISAFSFMITLSLFMIRANPIPLTGGFALASCSVILTYRLAGAILTKNLKLLTIFIAFPFLIALAHNWTFKASGGETPNATFKVEPYLQNVQKTSVRIMWETRIPLPGKVMVSANEKDLTQPGTANVCESPSKTLHEVTLVNLTENTTYYYRVFAGNDASETGSFRTAYEGPVPFEFAVYGDSQWMFDWSEHLVRNRHSEICRSILANSPGARFAVHVGDMTFLGNINENWSKQFFTPARKLMRNTVLWPTIGNHELNASLYFDYFSTPNSDEHYYSFDYGNSRFIVLAVEGYAVGHEYGPKTRTPMDPGSPQYEWLKKTLAESQDKSWRFVFCHQSPFASGLEGGYTPAQKILVPLFEQYKVNVVFSGHDHIYEASVKDNISYIVTGGGGGAVSPLQPDLRSNPFSRYLKGVWHHCNVNISPDRVLVKAIDLKGHAFHFVTIEQPSSPQVTVREGN